VIKLRPRQVKYKVARNGVEIGEHAKSELIQLYYDQKIKLTDYLWREGLQDWKTLYDLYAEFLVTPEQLRANDRELQMTTKTSYRIKYLIQKSRAWIKEKRKAPASFRQERKKLEKEIEALRIKAENEKDPDKWDDLNSELTQARGMLEISSISHEGRDEDYIESISDESKQELIELRSMRLMFWCGTFEGKPPELNKKDIKKLAKSYEERVSQILSGTVPWSSTYFQLGSLFSMPSSRTLYDVYGKNYIKPSEAEIQNILEKLDEEKPDWDDLNPELFYSDLKTIASA
jgi:hypothetical protein